MPWGSWTTGKLFLILHFKLLTQFPLSLFFLCSLSQSSLFSLSPSLLSLLINSLSSYDKDFKFHYILFHHFCTLFHTMTFFLIILSISLYKQILMLELQLEDLKKQWLHRRVGSRNSTKGGSLRPSFSSNCLFVSSIPSLLPFSILSLLPFLISPSLSTIPSCSSDQFSVLLR